MSDTTYDNSSNANDMEAEDGFASSMLTFAAIMTLLIMVVGIFGNFLTVAALIKCPKVRNVAAAFIMSLCIADLLFCALVLPFNAYRFIEGTWEPRDVLCKMIPFIQYGNIGVSLLCIAMITINRYVMIAHHSSYGKIYKRHWIAAMIIFCWVFSYGMQLPTLVGAWGTFGYDKKLGTCSILEDDHGHSSKTTLFVTAFVIPCIIIIACYTKIFWVVHKSEQRLKRHANKQNSIPNNLRTTPVATGSNIETGNGQSRVSSADSSSFSTDVKHESVQKQTTRVKDQREVRAKRNEWRITKMVLAIFLSFVICYLPITIAKVADQDVEHPNFHILSYIMLYLSACINPIIYVIMNKQYRKAYKTVIMCQPGRLLPFGKHAGGGGNNGSSVAEMERYRIEPHVAQSHNGFGSGPTKYQLQQFRPIASYGTEQQTERNKSQRYDRINTGDVAGSRVHTDSDIYREREQTRNSEHRRTGGGAIDKRTNAHSHSCPESQQEYQYHQQQQQPKRTSQPSNEYHNAKDHQTHSPGGRRYNFGGRGGRRGGGNAGSETDDSQSAGRRGEKRTDDNANINATSTVHCEPTADASVRECECIAPEEKPILRSEHQRHSR